MKPGDLTHWRARARIRVVFRHPAADERARTPRFRKKGLSGRRPTKAGGVGARARLLEINFPKSPLVEHCVRRPAFSLEINGFTRVKSGREGNAQLAKRSAHESIESKFKGPSCHRARLYARLITLCSIYENGQLRTTINASALFFMRTLSSALLLAVYMRCMLWP